MSRSRSVGALPEGLPEDHQRFLMQLRQQIEQVREIAARATGTGAGTPVAGTPGAAGPPGPPGDPGGSYTPDLTPPPTPSGVTVASGISFVSISTDNPTFTQGHGYLRTLVYGAKWTSGALPTFGSAVLVHEFVGNFGAFPTDPNTHWHLWLKWVSIDGEESTSPSGGTNGHQTTTGADVSGLLTVLNGQLTASQLNSTLGSRINQIDGSSATPGTVNYRIAASASDLTAAYTSAITTGNATTLASAQTYTQTYAYSRANVDGAFTSQFNALTANYQAGDAAALSSAQAYVNTYAYSRAQTDSAISSQVTTLAARIDNGNAAPFSPQLSWQFDGGLDGWSAYGAGYGTVSASSTSMVAVADPNIILVRNLSAAEQFLGARADKVRVRLRRTAGSVWDGQLYYGTPGHGDSGGHLKAIPEPVWGADGWAIAEWDMAALTAGGSDWTANTIQRLRLDLSETGSAGTSYEVDWIAVGTRAFGVSAAALQQEATVRATQTGELYAQWTVKTDINGYVAGFGLASTLSGATPYSEFIIRADQFAIAPVQTDNTAADGSPFFHRTSATTINGVSVPAGTYMKAAFMHDATITTAKIQDLAVTDAKMLSLSVAKLTAGSMAVGAHVRSTTYVSGTSGFTIEANGFAEFNNVTVRGTVYASAGTFAGSLSAATGTFAGSLSAATGTFAGNLSAAGGTFAGSLSAATGTFAGSLSAATGTFAGTLTAAVGSFLSSTSGQRITLNESSSNEARFYGNRGDGTITQLASIGINTVGSDSVVIAVGDTASGNSRVGVFARSNSSRAIQGTSVSGQGLFGLSTSAEGVWGQSTSQAGVIGLSSGTGTATGGTVGTNSSSGPGAYGISNSGPGVRGLSTSGHGVEATGNATRAALKLEPQTFPSVAAGGSVCISGGNLYFHNGSGWQVVLSSPI